MAVGGNAKLNSIRVDPPASYRLNAYMAFPVLKKEECRSTDD